jgi:DNA-binding Xre family transcriptional regulator
MREAYSRLSVLLEERGLSVDDLASRLRTACDLASSATLRQLADPDRPLSALDLRVAGAICHSLAIELNDLIAFLEPLRPQLQLLSVGQQARLDDLMDRHSEKNLHGKELAELQRLVAEVEQNDLYNAQRLVEHRARLRAGRTARESDAAD